MFIGGSPPYDQEILQTGRGTTELTANVPYIITKDGVKRKELNARIPSVTASDICKGTNQENIRSLDSAQVGNLP